MKKIIATVLVVVMTLALCSVAVNAENGEIEQIWHDDLSVGNG